MILLSRPVHDVWSTWSAGPVLLLKNVCINAQWQFFETEWALSGISHDYDYDSEMMMAVIMIQGDMRALWMNGLNFIQITYIYHCIMTWERWKKVLEIGIFMFCIKTYMPSWRIKELMKKKSDHQKTWLKKCIYFESRHQQTKYY